MNNSRYPGGKLLADVHIPDINHFTSHGGSINFDPHLPAVSANVKNPANRVLPSQRVRLASLQQQLNSWKMGVRGKLNG